MPQGRVWVGNDAFGGQHIPPALSLAVPAVPRPSRAAQTCEFFLWSRQTLPRKVPSSLCVLSLAPNPPGALTGSGRPGPASPGSGAGGSPCPAPRGHEPGEGQPEPQPSPEMLFWLFHPRQCIKEVPEEAARVPLLSWGGTGLSLGRDGASSGPFSEVPAGPREEKIHPWWERRMRNILSSPGR